MMNNKITKNKKGISKTFKWTIIILVIVLVIGLVGVGFLRTIMSLRYSNFADTMKLSHHEALSDSMGSMPYLSPMSNPNDEPYDATFFENYGVNPFISTEDEHFSTFGMDVDTAAYSICRRWINDGNVPDKDSVRTEEFINYFNQDYPNPEDNFGIYLEGAKSEFGQSNYHLLKIGVKAKEVSLAERKSANMIFLVDVSGSMSREDRLGLVKKSLTKLTNNLKEGDKIGLAVYAGGAGKIIDLTHNKNKILNALSKLESSGSTNIAQGLEIAYKMARDGFEEGKINRIIIASDGVANIGTTSADKILKQIKEDSDKGITLTTLGFGMGNFNDILMEKLANHGNGNYYYIDSEEEAERLFENGATSLLQVIGSDAKIQVEFNPETVDRFRLLGYENRRLETEDFRNDNVDAGEVVAGQTVTALYEIRIKDDSSKSEKLAEVRIRYKNIDTKKVEEKKESVTVSDVDKEFENASARFQFTASVAEFAEILKESYWAKDSSFDNVLTIAKKALSSMHADDKEKEFIQLVKKVMDLE